jgi:hypothetical protein
MVGLAWFFEASHLETSDLLLTHWAFRWAKGLAYTTAAIGVGLMVGIAVFSRIRFREIKETLGNRNLAMLAYTSMVTTQAEVLFSRPDVLITSLILVAVFMLVFYTYKKESALSELFHIGLGIGLCCLFLGQSILLMMSVTFSLLILRTGNAKEWIVFLLGLGMTAVFLGSITVWMETPIVAFKRIVQSAWLVPVSSGKLTVGPVLLLLLILASLGRVFSNITTGTVHLRNITIVNLAWILGVGLMVVIFGVDWQVGLVLSAFPLSSFLAQFIDSMNRWWVADTLLVLLIAAPILSILLPL